MPKYYKDIAEIQKLIWMGDDMIDQDNLFEVQDKIASLALRIAEDEKCVGTLVKEFPFLYKCGEE